jgi:hypothetical protein
MILAMIGPISGRSSGVEHNLAKVGVEGSNPFARSSERKVLWAIWFSNSRPMNKTRETLGFKKYFSHLFQ